MPSGMTVDNNLFSGMKHYFDLVGIRKKGKSTGADKKAKIVIALTLLNNIMHGSPKNPVVPPIKWGILRGSGSVFVGTELIQTTRGEAGNGDGTPATNISGVDDDTITIGINTSYAARMHEGLEPAGNLKPGPVSRQSGDVAGKFIESHLESDGKDLVGLYAQVLKKESGG